MLRLIFLLLSFFTDYRIVPEIAHCALTTGLATVGILCCICVSLILRHWLASHGH